MWFIVIVVVLILLWTVLYVGIMNRTNKSIEKERQEREEKQRIEQQKRDEEYSREKQRLDDKMKKLELNHLSHALFATEIPKIAKSLAERFSLLHNVEEKISFSMDKYGLKIGSKYYSFSYYELTELAENALYSYRLASLARTVFEDALRKELDAKGVKYYLSKESESYLCTVA